MPKPHCIITKEIILALRGESPRERLLHRLHAVVSVLSGLSAVKMARMYGDSSRAISYWVRRFKQQGIRGLEEEARPGRPSKLSAVQLKKVQTFIKQAKAKSKPVSAKTLSVYLRKEIGIALTPRQCWRILKRLES